MHPRRYKRGVTDRDAIGGHQGEAVLRPERERIDPRHLQRGGSGHPLSAVIRLRLSDRNQADRGHLAKVAIADGSDGRHHRRHPGVEHRDKRLRHCRAGAGTTLGNPADARQHGGADNADREQRTQASFMGAEHSQRKLGELAN